MLILSQHIEYLISRHDCVILPGIGAFIAVSRAAELDSENGSIIPPRRIISYNPAVVNDDGLLAHSIARKERTSFEEGRRKLEFKLNELRQYLSQHGKCAFGKIGTLSMESDGRLTFLPAMTIQQKERRSGMIPVTLTPVETSAGSSSCNNIATTEFTAHEESPVIKDPRYYHLRIPKVFVRVAASIAIFACTVLSLLISPGDTVKDTSKASVVEVESILKAVDSNKSELPTTPAPKKEQITVAKEDSTPGSHRFHLIVGTFSSESNAMEYISRHRESQLYMASGSGRTWRVGVMASDAREELQQLLNDREIQKTFSGAWIWEKK